MINLFKIIIVLIPLIIACKEDPINIPAVDNLFWEQTAKLNNWIEHLVIDNQNNVYAGSFNGELYYSENNGDSWLRLDTNSVLNIIESINSIAVNSIGDIFVSSGQVYRSTNKGNNWIEVTNSNIRIKHLLFNSQDVLFGLADGGNRMFRSFDNGDNWEVIYYDTLDIYPYPSRLVIDSNDKLYTCIESNEGGAYKSTDNGITWLKINDGWVWEIALNELNEIYIIKNYSNRVLYKSSNDGMTWGQISNYYVKYLTFNSRGDIFGSLGTDGVAYSIDEGRTWKQINNGLTQTFVRCLAINSLGYLFAGTVHQQPAPQPNQGEVYRSIKSTLY